VPRFEVGGNYQLALDLQPTVPILPTNEDSAKIELASPPQHSMDPGPYYNLIGPVSWRQGDGSRVASISVGRLFLGLDDPSLSPTLEKVTVYGTIEVHPAWLSAAGQAFPEVSRSFRVGRILREFAPLLSSPSAPFQDPIDWSRYRSEEATQADPWLFDSRDHELIRYLLGIWFPEDRP
jgi:hypothetical protein